MFTFDLTDTLRKRVRKLAKKNPMLALVFKRKIQEITRQTPQTIDTYKNLKSPMHTYKRIHLTEQHILLFTVDKKRRHIIFVDILHRDAAYK